MKKLYKFLFLGALIILMLCFFTRSVAMAGEKKGNPYEEDGEPQKIVGYTLPAAYRYILLSTDLDEKDTTQSILGKILTGAWAAAKEWKDVKCLMVTEVSQTGRKVDFRVEGWSKHFHDNPDGKGGDLPEPLIIYDAIYWDLFGEIFERTKRQDLSKLPVKLFRFSYRENHAKLLLEGETELKVSGILLDTFVFV